MMNEPIILVDIVKTRDKMHKYFYDLQYHHMTQIYVITPDLCGYYVTVSMLDLAYNRFCFDVV